MHKVKKIGSGTYSMVYHVKSPGGTSLALKRAIVSGFDLYGNPRELDVTRKLYHDHVIEIRRIAKGNPYINQNAMSPLDRGPKYRDDTMHLMFPLAVCDLHRYRKIKGWIEMSELKRLMLEILLALEYIHETGFIHRDFKMDNILMHEEEISMEMAKSLNLNLTPPAPRPIIFTIPPGPSSKLAPVSVKPLPVPIFKPAPISMSQRPSHFTPVFQLLPSPSPQPINPLSGPRIASSGNVKLLRVKIADFGLSKAFSKYMTHTPRITTCWYRAPEVCMNSVRYDTKVDLWAAGCVMYELYTGKPFCGSLITEENQLLMDSILLHLPYSVDVPTFHRMNIYQQINQIKVSKIVTVAGFLRLTEDEYQKRLSQDPVNMKNFYDLMLGLLSFDPEKRFNATQAIAHPFFAELQGYASLIRTKFPPELRAYPPVKIHLCQEREWMKNLMYLIYINRAKYPIWYNERVLFQTINIFDRFLIYASESEKTDKAIIPTSDRGQILSREVAELYVYVCVYLAIKHFSTLNPAIPMIEILPPNFRERRLMKLAENFELTLIETVLRYDIFHETVYDFYTKTHQASERDINSILLFIFNGHHINKTPKDACQFWLNHRAVYDAYLR